MQVYTIGHSTHSLDQFAALLRLHEIQVVADVRSAPYSRMNPQYNRENLQRALVEAGFSYVYLGKELGGRVDYEAAAKTELFQHGLDRVMDGIARYRIALMCAEREPGECHRTLLVSRHLEARGVSVQHILADGRLESQVVLIERMREKLGLPESDLFRSPSDIRAEVYRQLAP